MKQILAVLFVMMAFSNCINTPVKNQMASLAKPVKVNPVTSVASAHVATTSNKVADAATILERKQVPVLCYHHIRDWKPNEKSSLKLLLVPIEHFKDQIKSLADSGYHTITPDEYYDYLTNGTPLPSKPIMITFDDTDEDQYTIGAAELNKYHFKGVFFVMTISIGRPNYMSSQQIKELSDQGHIIAAHTWDHHSVKQLQTEKDYIAQFVQPKQKLEIITGKPVDCFAYPFGIVDTKVIPELQKAGYASAYQLVEFKRDSTYPLYTIRRMIVPGAWNGATMQKWMKNNFH